VAVSAKFAESLREGGLVIVGVFYGVKRGGG
jgi:hypothetical protein